MRQMNKVQSALFLIGGVLMVIGAGCYVFLWQREVVCWVFLAGACLFGGLQLMQTYEGRNFTVKRLKRIMSVADMFFIFAGLVMVDNAYMLSQSLFDNYASYLEMVFNKWVLLLLVAAVLEIYTMHRISSELDKEQQSQSKKILKQRCYI